MIVIGLTGSIGMGKSTAAKVLRDEMGVPVHDADTVAHKLMAPNGAAVLKIASIFPASVEKDDQGEKYINRKTLGSLVFNNAGALKKLEDILHPMIRADRRQFLISMKKSGHKMVVLDLPLLFETGEDKHVNSIICMSAPKDVQKKRVLARPNMTEEKFNLILNKQLPDKEKRNLSDIVIETGRGMDDMRQQLRVAIDAIKKKHEQARPVPKNGF